MISLREKKIKYNVITVTQATLEKHYLQLYNKWEQVLNYFLPVSGGLKINSLRYAAVTWRALDGVQLLCSLVVDSITSPYIDGSGERIPSKFDQRDYKPPRSRSFKPHLCCLQGPQYITPSVRCIYQYPSPCHCRSPKIR